MSLDCSGDDVSNIVYINLRNAKFESFRIFSILKVGGTKILAALKHRILIGLDVTPAIIIGTVTLSILTVEMRHKGLLKIHCKCYCL